MMSETPQSIETVQIGTAGRDALYDRLASMLCYEKHHQREGEFCPNCRSRAGTVHGPLVLGVVRQIVAAREGADEQVRLMENLYGVRQVWCVAYDSPNPSMDGRPHPIRMADQDHETAVRNYEFMQRQQRVAPKRNLRIETRWVSDFTDVTEVVVDPPD